MTPTIEKETEKQTTPTVHVVLGKTVKNVPCNGHTTVADAVAAAGGKASAKGTFSVNEREAGPDTVLKPGDTVVLTPKTCNG